MNKKGVVEVQFNWIYVGVVGVIILLLFINIIANMRENSQRQLEFDVLNYFDSIFASLQGSENAQNPLELSGLELEIRTQRDDCYFYTFKGSNTEGTSTEFVPLFTPDTIKTKILSYALAWDVPFRANYFLYMTSPEISYVFVGDDFETEELYEDVPDHLTKELQRDANDYINHNYYKVRFISFTENPASFNLDSSVTRLDDADVSAVYIDENSVTYYQKENAGFVESQTTFYLDKATLMAALYSETAGAYECNIDDKALKRINRVASVLKKRIDLLKKANILCDVSNYNQARSLLTQLEDLTSERGFSQSKVSEIKTIRNELRNINENLRDRACATIY